jgi:hypothetical protein
MARIKAFLGYGWAILCFFIVIGTFLLSPLFARTFASVTGLSISPWHTGGAVERVISHGAYETRIHRPVFDGLLSPRKTGFIQVDWQPRRALPPFIEEGIDFDKDGKEDFLVRLDTKKGAVELVSRSPAAREVERVFDLGEDGFAVRVVLRK